MARQASQGAADAGRARFEHQEALAGWPVGCEQCAGLDHQLCEANVARQQAAARLGLGRIVALYHCSSTLYHIC
jgi:hypothetical protein